MASINNLAATGDVFVKVGSEYGSGTTGTTSTVSTNTVENFYHINDLIKTKYYDQIIICTSEFHYKRAKKISDYFIENNNVGWILSKEKLATSYSDENFHYKNIEKDIEKLKNKLELN